MLLQVDLNADMGEGFSQYQIGCDGQLIQHISSANIACGWHAGDPQVMDKTIAIAKKFGVGIGAHPGYPDLLGFGRRNLSVTPDEQYAYVLYQLGALSAFAKKHAMEIQHLKAHGAMYNMAANDIRLAVALCRAIKDFDPQIILLGLAGSMLLAAAEDVGLRFASEVFADRAYEEDGSLVARTKAGSIINDEKICVARAVRMIKEGRVEAVTGSDIAVKADSICLHGDGPKALLFATRIRQALVAEDVQVVGLNHFVKAG